MTIKVRSYPYKTEEEAQDALAGVASIPGYVFGYVETRPRFRTISFHQDIDGFKGDEVTGLERVFSLQG